MTKYYAHIDQKDRMRRQTLLDHLENTARECANLGEEVEMENLLYYVGLLHDSGKIKYAFQQKILHNGSERVDHSTFGGLLTLNFLDEIYDTFRQDVEDDHWASLTEDLKRDPYKIIYLNDFVHTLVYPIMSHHGPFDLVRQNESYNYVYTPLERAERERKSAGFENDSRTFLKMMDEKGIDLRQIFIEGFKEYVVIVEKLKKLAERTGSDIQEAMLFYHGMLMRLIVSILKSADIKDTINSYETVIEDEDEEILQDLVDDFEKRVLSRYESFGEPTKELDFARKNIADAILERSKRDSSGIYTLDLPTGAGKTLLSLRYGTNQMRYCGKRRFFYVTSYLSVLEQNAESMKEVLQNKEYILEHHSNVVREDEEERSIGKRDEKEDSLEAVRRNFLVDDWTSPVVLTTMVQFFNTLFKGRSGNLTRFKSLINSVVVLDELQSLPSEVLYLMNLALNFMKTVLKTTVVLSTATQPTYGSMSLVHRLDYGNENGEKKEIVTVPSEDVKSFERSKVFIYGSIEKEYTLDDVADFVLEERKMSQLIILNTKGAVRGLYDRLVSEIPEKDLYYLTTNLTAADRLKRIGEIKKRLELGEPICVVSTQLIEAGVDVDFARVVRSLTGIDSIVQARGRCNREGKRKDARTYIVNINRKEENIAPLKGMRERKLASRLILEGQEGEVDIEELITPYFEKLYANLKKNELLEPLDPLAKNQKKKDILLKSIPSAEPYDGGIAFADEKVLHFFQSFKSAYDNFQLIDDSQEVAIVDYEETHKDLEKLRDLDEDVKISFDGRNLKEMRGIIRSLTRHTVPVRKEVRDQCEKILDGTVNILPNNFYNERFGVNVDDPDNFLL
nr:CRISPR-associated helicase Cas3' [uncultured Peptoniphilus sp.]